MENQYEAWKTAVITGRPLKVPKDVVPSGRYRYRDEGVAIWRDKDGRLFYKRGRKGKNELIGDGGRFACEADFAEAVFGYFAKNPISDAVYQNWLETGDWPDDPPKLPTDNLPLDPYERAKALLEIEIELFEEWVLKSDPALRETSDKAARWAQRIGGLADSVEEMRVAEKRPHDEAAKAVQAKWVPLRDRAQLYTRKAKDLAGVWLKAEQARLDALHREEQRKAREAALKQDVSADPLMADVPTTAPKAQAGGKGSVVSLTKVRRGVIEDAEKLVAFLLAGKNPDFLACIQKIADAGARSKLPLPGVKIVEEDRAR